jgi:hypothetical protein
MFSTGRDTVIMPVRVFKVAGAIYQIALLAINLTGFAVVPEVGDFLKPVRFFRSF